MVFNTTSINQRGVSRHAVRRRCGALLVEYLIAVGLTGLVLMVVGLLVMFGARSFVAMSNYVALDQRSRDTLDRMTKEIRQCNRLLGSHYNYLLFEDADGGTLLYYYADWNRTLYRFKDWQMSPGPLLTGCDFLQFSIFQRNPIIGTYNQYPTATPTTCKVVQLSWVCSRPILGGQNTESVQSAKVVIRKQ
jgi:hypothetical protein